MGTFWSGKLQKRLQYYQEHSLAALCVKNIKFFGKTYLRFYYRASTKVRMARDRLGMLKRARPYEGIPDVIISLTSFPARIRTVHQAIETLLVQTYKADRIILWLARDEFPGGKSSLPPQLQKLCDRGVEIRWCENLRSYKKLIPTLASFPNDIIITFDDDILVHKSCVQRLLKGYVDRPDCIQCHRAAMMIYHTPDHVDRVLDFKKGDSGPTYLYEPTGCGGCLYPPHCFHRDITHQELFMTLAPTNDDLWFWLMGALNGYRVNIAENNISRLTYIPYTQEVGLFHINNEGEKLLFVQLKNILQYYPELDKLLLNEQKRMEELV